MTPWSNPFLASSNIKRPRGVYNSPTRKYVLWAHDENGKYYKEARVIVARADAVDGDYVYRGSFRPFGYEYRDMTIVADADGAADLVSAAQSNYDLNVYKLNASYTDVANLTYTFEGFHKKAPAVSRRGSNYFLVGSAATGWAPNQAVNCRSNSMSGHGRGRSISQCEYL